MKEKQIVNEPMHEHDSIVSRTTGERYEISMGPQSDGKVPRNPFASKSQQRWAFANPSVLGGKDKVKEWADSTDFKNLPEKIKHKK